ncbi:hypothetical protein IT072_15445 [Leifsonia sp. ZF2019]|uniref:hypothetical protein n=1 Tax=Leifsonia sp. ZF2019 TaxID=2781978 RepID=UPI001CBE861F|nr:hypothetical protein [Leifsonia sp. ZF2019]UAJ78623.1 hypothetical protein IT072_15445 [Leifsonia sp. ZF2019]
MTTTTETTPPIFGGTYAGLADHPLVAPLLPTFDGYDALVAEMQRIEESAQLSSPATSEVGGYYSDQGVEMVLAGESVLDVARRIVEAEDEARLQKLVDGLMKTALERSRSRAGVWLNEHLPAIIEAVDERLQSVVAEARQLCDGPLRGGATVDQIVVRPELLQPFTRLTELSRTFAEIESLVRSSFVGQHQLAETGPSLPKPWMLSHIIRGYEAAWPKFWLSVSLTIQDRSGNTFGTLEGQHNPLAPIEDRPLELLRWIADHHVEVWIPLNQSQLRDHRKSIDDLWEQRRDEAVVQGLTQRGRSRG